MIYKLLKREIVIQTAAQNDKLLEKYDLIKSVAYQNKVCHLMHFANRIKIVFDNQSNFVAKFDTTNETLEVKCMSSGGLSELDLKKHTKNDLNLYEFDRKCVNYALEFIEDLKEEGIIE